MAHPAPPLSSCLGVRWRLPRPGVGVTFYLGLTGRSGPGAGVGERQEGGGREQCEVGRADSNDATLPGRGDRRRDARPLRPGERRSDQPRGPIPILDVMGEYQMLGGAANVTMKVAELGSSARMVGLVGVDPPAAELRALLAGQPEITDSLVSDSGRLTTVKTRFMAHNQQLLRADREIRRPPAGETLHQIAQTARAAAAAADAVILVDYGKGVLCSEVISAALEGAGSSGALVVVDSHGLDYTRYAGATVLTPNLKEVELASQRPINDLTSLEDAAQWLVDQSNAAIAVTRGPDGISLFRRGGPGEPVTHTPLPTWPIAVHDVTGAGDAVTAVIAIALASGIDMADACSLANLAGGSVVGQLGVGTLSIAHLLAESRRESLDPGLKVVDIARACQSARRIRETGGRVVFTNGCFDILHQGHMNLLRFARGQGDILILGLNSDASVKRHKGPSRPYVPEAQRSYMLSLYPFVQPDRPLRRRHSDEHYRSDSTGRAGQRGRLHPGDGRGPHPRRVVRRRGGHLPAIGRAQYNCPPAKNDGPLAIQGLPSPPGRPRSSLQSPSMSPRGTRSIDRPTEPPAPRKLSVGLLIRAHGINKAFRSHIGPVGLDPVETFLARAHGKDNRPTRGCRPEGRPQGVLVLFVDQDNVLATVIFEWICHGVLSVGRDGADRIGAHRIATPHGIDEMPFEQLINLDLDARDRVSDREAEPPLGRRIPR